MISASSLPRGRNSHGDDRAAARGPFEMNRRADEAGPLADADQAARRGSADALRRKAATIVANREQQFVSLALQLQLDAAGVRMPRHIGQRLLHDAIDRA